MTLPKRRPPASFAAAVIVVVLGVAIWLVLRNASADLDERIEQELDTLASMTAAADGLDALEKTKREMSALARSVADQLLDVPENATPESQIPLAQTQLNEIFSALTKKAGLTDVMIKYSSEGKRDKESPYQLVKLQATMRCDEKQFTEVLLGLANHRKLVAVTELQLTSNWRNPKLPVLTVDITIGGYYRPTVETSG